MRTVHLLSAISIWPPGAPLVSTTVRLSESHLVWGEAQADWNETGEMRQRKRSF